MKKILSIVLFAFLSPSFAHAVEFQTPGALGIGGAGVARNNGALTSYWNPAAGAFNHEPTAVSAGAGAGVRGSDGVTDNIDRFSKIDFSKVRNFDTATSTAENIGDLVKTFSILYDIDLRKGNIAAIVDAPVGISTGRFSFGVYGNLEGYVLPKADMINILPVTTGTGAPVTLTNLYTPSVAAGTYVSSGYFSADQLNSLSAQIQANSSLTQEQSDKLARAIDNQLQGSGIPANTVFSSLTDVAIPALNQGGTNTLNKNTTSVLTKALQYIEVPLSYGHPFELGSSGKLGIGITGKLISGTVYQNQLLLVNRPNNDKMSVDNLVKDITQNRKNSVSFSIDLGALYRYEDWLSVGIVGKNLNSPKFEAPVYFEPVYNEVTKQVELTRPVAGTSVELKPQIRTGVALDPIPLVSFAADLDLTENETVSPAMLSGNSFKSRNLGGGVELRPLSWFRLRGGAYRNLASSDIGQVLTAGFSFFLLDVDGAFSTDTFKVDGRTLPKECKVLASLAFAL